jgi:hypothetical protein
VFKDKSPDWSETSQYLLQQCTEIPEKNMVTKKGKAQASKRSGSGARGKPHTGGGRDQQGGGKEASSGDRSKRWRSTRWW